MKYKSKIYAKALADLLVDKISGGGLSPSEEKRIISNFLNLLEINSDLSKAKEIIFFAENFLLKKTGNKKIILESARNIDIKNLPKPFVKKGDVLEQRINEKLIAGLKIIIDDKQLDFSLQKKLNEIFS